jgi:hypothetical protein
MAPDLPAIARPRALGKHALRAVEWAQRIYQGQRRLLAGPQAHLRLRRADPGVPLQKPVGKIAPFGALSDEGQFGGTLDRHLRFDKFAHPHDFCASQLGKARPLVAQDPGIAIGIGADVAGHCHVLQDAFENDHRVWIVGVLEVMIDAVYQRLALGVLHFQARHKERALALGADGKGNRPFCGNEGKVGEIAHIVIVEQDGA